MSPDGGGDGGALGGASSARMVSVSSLVSESARAVALGGSAGWPPRPPPRKFRVALPPAPLPPAPRPVWPSWLASHSAGASAKGDAVPVVPVADLDNGAEQRERYSDSAVSASSSTVPTPSRTSASSISFMATLRIAQTMAPSARSTSERKDSLVEPYARRGTWRGVQ